MENPSAVELKEWYQKSGLPLNVFLIQRNLYKEMKLKDRLPEMSEEEQIELLSTDGMLVKRPSLWMGTQSLSVLRRRSGKKDSEVIFLQSRSLLQMQ